MLQVLGTILGIVLVDLALSGDNALVIGAAASALPRTQRYTAMLVGGAGAIILRIALAIAATLLLQLPFLQAAGGLIILIIAYRLLAEREQRRMAAARSPDTRETTSAATTQRFFAALLTIMVADITMSLDNVLAVGALAHGQVALLAVGLVISIGIVLVGSALVAELIGRLPWVLDFAALVLAWTAAHMLLSDSRVGAQFHLLPWLAPALYALALALVLLADIALRRRTRHQLARLAEEHVLASSSHTANKLPEQLR